MPRLKVVPIKVAQRNSGGRPRKYLDEELVDAALRILERDGYAALTIRSLAQELGTTHATLYNYIDAIEEIEARALHKLTAQLSAPTASSAPELRSELLAYLIAVWSLVRQHPDVLFPPKDSISWNILFEVGERWIRALQAYAPNEKTTRLALGSMVSVVIVAADRDRVYGTGHGKVGVANGMGRLNSRTLEQTLDELADLVFPGLSATKKSSTAAKRRSKRGE